MTDKKPILTNVEQQFFSGLRKILEQGEYRRHKVYMLFGSYQVRKAMEELLVLAEREYKKQTGILPRRAGERWNEGEDRVLREYWNAGKSLKEITSILHRSSYAIAGHLVDVGAVNSPGASNKTVPKGHSKRFVRVGLPWSESEKRLIRELQGLSILDHDTISKILHREINEVAEHAPSLAITKSLVP